jgi:cysteine sulfinate desulfinase/cysteine desulfurase-like protein
MQVPSELLQSSIRFSLSRFTTVEEIEEAVRRIVGCVKKLKKQPLFAHSSHNSTIG